MNSFSPILLTRIFQRKRYFDGFLGVVSVLIRSDFTIFKGGVREPVTKGKQWCNLFGIEPTIAYQNVFFIVFVDAVTRIRKLAEVPPSVRGWTLDVLRAVRRLGKSQFSLGDVYDFESELQIAHPLNRNVRPKIRQQLQVLRDLGLIEFATRGTYSISE